MALDVGERRIGVALSDPTGTIASPLTILHRVAEKKDLEAICDLVEQHAVDRVVIGLPRTLSGEEGPQARRVRRFGEHLAEVLHVPVVYWDERYSTADAERIAAARSRTRGRGGRVAVDDVAAAVILQSYLDSSQQSRGGHA
ncbi:MAG: Holliday junction resolvase RuvX [Sphingomonadaceae bacterium]